MKSHHYFENFIYMKMEELTGQEIKILEHKLFKT